MDIAWCFTPKFIRSNPWQYQFKQERNQNVFFGGKHIEKLKSTYLWRVASAESISKGRSREREFTIVSLMGVRGPPRSIFQVYMRFRAIWVISGALQRSFKRPTISFFYDADRWWGFGGPPSRKFEM